MNGQPDPIYDDVIAGWSIVSSTTPPGARRASLRWDRRTLSDGPGHRGGREEREGLQLLGKR